MAAEQEPPHELSLAGSVVDKAIEYMMGQNVPPVAIASALLGGSLALLARSLGDEAIGVSPTAVRVPVVTATPSRSTCSSTAR